MDIALLQRIYGVKIDQRIAELERAIALFHAAHRRKTGDTLIFKKDSAALITYLYFYWHSAFIKPFIAERANRFKVASGTELAICYLQPITVQSQPDIDCRPINAEFAYFCALNFILGFKPGDDAFHISETNWLKFDCGIQPLEEEMMKILQNHKVYLTHLSRTETPPLISNAAFWEVVSLMHDYKFQALMV